MKFDERRGFSGEELLTCFVDSVVTSGHRVPPKAEGQRGGQMSPGLTQENLFPVPGERTRRRAESHLSGQEQAAPVEGVVRPSVVEIHLETTPDDHSMILVHGDVPPIKKTMEIGS